jgi:hypothetical protein
MGKSTESYAHKAAKETLVGWLRGEAERVGLGEYARMAGLIWEVTDGPPDWGVWSEYPIVQDGEGPIFWQDQPDGPFKGQIPTYAEMIGAGIVAPAIVDVIIRSDKHIFVAFEIVHKHEPDWTKCYFLEQMGMMIRGVPAYWILGQVEPSVDMPEEFVKTFRSMIP